MHVKAAVKVLVIEDDADVRKGIVQTLSEEFFSVNAADSGTEGLYYANQWEYDVIVLDVMLPEMNGWKVLKHLRQSKSTPVLMLSALGDIDDRVAGLNGGADDYLVKPYNNRELIARVRALTRRATSLTNDTICIGRVVVNLSTQTISLDGEMVNLTAAQYKLLEYLSRRVGAVVSRSELSDAIGINDDSLSNVLDVQIHHIRRKLGKDFVQSRRGLGFIIPVNNQA